MLLLLAYAPTAQTSLVEITVNPCRMLFPRPTFGLGTMLHCVPSQCMVSVRSLLLLLEEVPTAQTSVAETVVTLLRKLLFDPTFGLGLCSTASRSSVRSVSGT